MTLKSIHIAILEGKAIVTVQGAETDPFMKSITLPEETTDDQLLYEFLVLQIGPVAEEAEAKWAEAKLNPAYEAPAAAPAAARATRRSGAAAQTTQTSSTGPSGDAPRTPRRGSTASPESNQLTLL